jgi:hypothetical protein
MACCLFLFKWYAVYGPDMGQIYYDAVNISAMTVHNKTKTMELHKIPLKEC